MSLHFDEPVAELVGHAVLGIDGGETAFQVAACADLAAVPEPHVVHDVTFGRRYAHEGFPVAAELVDVAFVGAVPGFAGHPAVGEMHE